MRIAVTRSGGFAGLRRCKELRTEGHPDADRLEELARTALAAEQDTAGLGVPDALHYEITVDGRSVHCADPQLSEAQRELVRTVLREGT